MKLWKNQTINSLSVQQVICILNESERISRPRNYKAMLIISEVIFSLLVLNINTGCPTMRPCIVPSDKQKVELNPTEFHRALCPIKKKKRNCLNWYSHHTIVIFNTQRQKYVLAKVHSFAEIWRMSTVLSVNLQYATRRLMHQYCQNMMKKTMSWRFLNTWFQSCA